MRRSTYGFDSRPEGKGPCGRFSLKDALEAEIDHPSLCQLYSVPGGIIGGDAAGNLHWVPTEEITKFDWLSDLTTIPAAPGSTQVMVPVPARGPSGAVHFKKEEIRLRTAEVHGLRVQVGFGPKTRCWYVGGLFWDDVKELLVRKGKAER